MPEISLSGVFLIFGLSFSGNLLHLWCQSAAERNTTFLGIDDLCNGAHHSGKCHLYIDLPEYSFALSFGNNLLNTLQVLHLNTGDQLLDLLMNRQYCTPGS